MRGGIKSGGVYSKGGVFNQRREGRVKKRTINKLIFLEKQPRNIGFAVLCFVLCCVVLRCDVM